MRLPRTFAILTVLTLSGTAAVAAPGVESGTAELAPATTELAVPPSAILYYKQKCLVCHGTRGAGDGPGAAKLNPKPRSFRDPEWQKTSDDAIKKATLEGGAAVGKSPGMPAHPDLKKKPDVVNGLVALIRTFKE